MNSAVLLQREHVKRGISLHWPSIPFRTIYGLGIVSSLLLLVFYVYSVNQITKSAYLIKNYGKELDLLIKENRGLQAQFTESGVLEQFMNRAEALNFEKTVNPTYVQLKDHSLARAESVK